MKAYSRILLVSALLALTPATSLALPSDQSQPIRIESDTAEMDEKQGVSIYRGRVKITQGSVKIQADKVTVESNKKGVNKIIATGRPAHYAHQPKADDPIVNAYGEVIQYFASDQKIVILRNARLEQDENVFLGDRINYDIQKQLVKAHSNGNTTSGSTGERQRVEIVIQPTRKQEEPTE